MHKRAKTIIQERDAFLWVNIALFGVVSLLLFYYVMVANSVASKNYRVQILHDKLEALAETNGVLMTKKIISESPTALLEFARLKNLVEAKNILYIFENKNVAQR